MNAHIPLSLLLITGCSVSLDLGGETDAAKATDPSPTTDDSDPSRGEYGPETTALTDATPTGGGHTHGMHDESDSGSHSGSQSDSGQTDSGIGSTSINNDTTTTGDTTTTDDTATGEDRTTGEDGASTTGVCLSEAGPDPVELGEADDLAAVGAYVLLSKAGITNVPGSAITGGHVGVSPIASTAMTGFSLVLDPSGMFSTSPAVVAPYRIYAAEYAVPTPANLTNAILAMQAAYTDAASRVPTDYLNLGSGDIGGLTLGPGIYTWGTSVMIPKDVTLEGCAGDVWIFQIANDLDVSTGKSVLLAGGAEPHNVFWQIAGQATIHVGAHLEGVILSKTGITFQTNATLAGRALAQTAIALDQNAITAP